MLMNRTNSVYSCKFNRQKPCSLAITVTGKYVLLNRQKVKHINIPVIFNNVVWLQFSFIC